MEKFEFKKDEGSYSSSKGRYFKYFFNKKEEGLFQIGETDDYFYFIIMLRESYLKDKFILKIEKDNFLFEYLSTLIEGYRTIEVMEEGTPEKKSVEFSKNKDSIDITFNLTEQEKAFYTIELANLRRLGDTRFKKLIPSKSLTAQEQHEAEFDFRYKFKARIHQMLDEIENELKEEHKI